ncbi:ECF-type sigma factor [Sphingomonas sp. UNC305MFCol5.2]|uniref:ECF-type sigma factor n=1 Tax=Sphingomonas sp. UNC305MFCol5.2 TaxID=1449076 RepID=UPI000565B0CB|nr:ECF-type sigma factor [Sphingomonas sp. UNC305MFCol5.2]
MATDPDTAGAKDFASAGIDEALYADLHRVARRERFRAGRPDTLQTTAVLHEAYVRLAARSAWESRDHFLAVAATTMRYVLVDAARARLAAKRGDGERAMPLDAAGDMAMDAEDRQVVKLGEALEALACFDPELARLVDCRFFVGMTEDEIARVLAISDRTVRRRWLQARAWIYQEMAD